MITPHQFIAVAVRLFALWLLLTSTQIALLAYAMRSTVQHGGEASFVLAAIYLLLAGLLWAFPFAVARGLLPRHTGETTTSVASTDAVAVAFVAAGLVIISLKALTPVANYLSLLTMLLLSGQGFGQAPSLHVDGLIGIAMLVIGGTLVLRCRTLAARILPRPSATPSR